MEIDDPTPSSSSHHTLDDDVKAAHSTLGDDYGRWGGRGEGVVGPRREVQSGTKSWLVTTAEASQSESWQKKRERRREPKVLIACVRWLESVGSAELRRWQTSSAFVLRAPTLGLL